MDQAPGIGRNPLLHLIAWIFLAPVLLTAALLKTANTLVISLGGTLGWLVLLRFFFTQVFPLL